MLNFTTASSLTISNIKGVEVKLYAFCVIAFQAVLHASAEQTTTRYAGARQRLYQKISHLGTMRMFRPYCKKKGDFYGESI